MRTRLIPGGIVVDPNHALFALLDTIVVDRIGEYRTGGVIHSFSLEEPLELAPGVYIAGVVDDKPFIREATDMDLEALAL